MQLKVSNFNKPSHKKLKLIADTMLYALPLFMGGVTQLPLNDTQIKWVMFGLSTLIVVFKTISKFTSDEVETGEEVSQG